MRSRYFILGALLVSSVLAFGLGAYIYYQDLTNLQDRIRATFAASARQLATSLSVAVKVRDIPSVHQMMSVSSLAKNSDYVQVKTDQGTILFETGPVSKPCPGITEEQAIEYFGETAGTIAWCYRVDAGSSGRRTTALIGFLVLAVAAQVFAMFMLWKYHTVHIRRFMGDLDAVDLASIRPEFPAHKATGDAAIDKLYEKVSWLIAELNRISVENQKSQRLLAVANTTQMLAHDVRKPFSVLKMGLTMLERVTTPEGLHSTTARIRTEVERSLAKVNAMLQDITEIGASAAPLCESVRAEDIICDALAEAAMVHTSANIQIGYSLQHSRCLLVSPRKVQRLFSNIIDNAVQAMKGSGRLEFTSRDVEQEGRLCIEFAVINDGPRIPPEDIDRIFGAYFTRGKSLGTGLGLAIAQKVVTDHQGAIWCVSGADEKTRFCFTLPAASDACPPGNTKLQPELRQYLTADS